MQKIYPTIISSDLSEVEAQLAPALAAPDAISQVMIQIIDGEFAPALTVTPEDLAHLDFGSLQVDFHLITNEPLDYIWEIFDHTPPLPLRSISAQIEHLSDVSSFLQEVVSHEYVPGIALDLYTPIEEISADWLAEKYGLKQIILMGTEVGETSLAPAQFNPLVIQKLAELIRTYGSQIKDKEIEVVLSGGVTPEVITQAHAATPPEFHDQLAFAADSYLWQGDFTAQLEKLLI